MTISLGGALMEELTVEKGLSFFVNQDLAGYEVSVRADIPHQEVIFLNETDSVSSPMKAKGVIELGLCASAPRWPRPSTTRPACGCASTRSRLTS